MGSLEVFAFPRRCATFLVGGCRLQCPVVRVEVVGRDAPYHFRDRTGLSPVLAMADRPRALRVVSWAGLVLVVVGSL